MAQRILAFAYGSIAYAIFFGTFLYAIGFVGNFLVPRSLDGEPRVATWTAVLINLGLLAIFALQHSVMARPVFKRWWTRYVPQPVERSTYTLLSSLALILLFWQWQPIGLTVWEVQNPAGRALLSGLCAVGFLIVLFSTFLINHFDLFGLRQVWLHLRGLDYTPLRFRTPALYRYVRHPLYVGWFVAFWATPKMTAAHLLFALATSAYILIAIQLEERDLIAEHGERYVDYRRRTPMLVPSLKKLGAVGFTFFLVKGLAWLIAPAAIYLLR